MAKFCEFQLRTSEDNFYVNVEEIQIVNIGEDEDTASIELSGKRSFIVKGDVAENMAKIQSIS